MTDRSRLPLGVRPKDEIRYGRAIRFKDHTKVIPTHPLTNDDTNVGAFPMDRNDRNGTCVAAGAAHFIQIVTGLLTSNAVIWTDGQVVAFYKTQNPNFPADDNGMVIQQGLDYLIKTGVILGYATVDPTDHEAVRAAQYLGLGLIGGYNLQVAQQQQAVFDYVPGSPDWGGHCMVEARYVPTLIGDVTWSTVENSTDAFQTHLCSELYFVITQAHVDHPGFRAGFNLDTFGQAYTDLTGRPFVWAPGPTPPPSPTPEPSTPADATFAAVLLENAGHPWPWRIHVGENETVARAAQAWLRAKGDHP